MSKVLSTSSTSSNFQGIFYAAMKEYEKKTKKDLLAHPLIGQLQPCNTPADILTVLRGQVQQFDKSTSGVEKWTKWLNPTVNVLVALSGALGEGVGLVSFIWTILLFSTFDIALPGIFTCESDFRWCWRAPFGTYHRRSPYSDCSHTELYRRQRTSLRAEIRSLISSIALKASSDGLKLIPKCRQRMR